jgi:hypothetical protein
MLGTCLVRLGELGRAEAQLTQAIDLYRQLEMRPYLVRALFTRAELLMQQGRPAEADGVQTEAEALLAAISRESM